MGAIGRLSAGAGLILDAASDAPALVLPLCRLIAQRRSALRRPKRVGRLRLARLSVRGRAEETRVRHVEECDLIRYRELEHVA